MSETASETEPHPLDGTFAYFDSELKICVGPKTKYKLDGIEYEGQFTFTGTYSVLLAQKKGGENIRYCWPVIGGTINELRIGDDIQSCGYEIAFVIFSPDVKDSDPTYSNIDLSRFVDVWTGYAGVESNGRVKRIELRFVNVTFIPKPPQHVSDQVPLGYRSNGRVANLGSGPTGREKEEPIRTAWSAFSWQPTWEAFGARGYIRTRETRP